MNLIVFRRLSLWAAFVVFISSCLNVDRGNHRRHGDTEKHDVVTSVLLWFKNNLDGTSIWNLECGICDIGICDFPGGTTFEFYPL